MTTPGIAAEVAALPGLKDAWPCTTYPIPGALGFRDVPDEAVGHIEETSLRVCDGFKLV